MSGLSLINQTVIDLAMILFSMYDIDAKEIGKPMDEISVSHKKR